MENLNISLPPERATAIRNLGGSTAAYLRYLKKFRDKYSTSPEEISRLISAGNRDEAIILIHSVKGLSATLGLTEVACAASALESALKNRGETISEHLSEYKKQLQRSLNE